MGPRLRSRTLAIVAGSLLLGSATPGQRLDLAGTWSIDRSKCESQFPIPDVTLHITQQGPVIAVEGVYRTPEGIRVVYDTAVADGKEAPYTFRRPNGQEGSGRRTTRWSAEGTALEVSDSVLLDAPSGPTPRWTSQRWTLSADRATLTEDLTLRQPFVSFPVKYVFARSTS